MKDIMKDLLHRGNVVTKMEEGVIKLIEMAESKAETPAELFHIWELSCDIFEQAEYVCDGGPLAKTVDRLEARLVFDIEARREGGEDE